MEKTMVKTMKTPKKLAKWVSANLFAAEPIKKHKHSQGCRVNRFGSKIQTARLLNRYSVASAAQNDCLQ